MLSAMPRNDCPRWTGICNSAPARARPERQEAPRRRSLRQEDHHLRRRPASERNDCADGPRRPHQRRRLPGLRAGTSRSLLRAASSLWTISAATSGRPSAASEAAAVASSNPIENAFAKLKALLRKARCAPLMVCYWPTRRALHQQECANFFAAAGHVQPDRKPF